MRIKSYGHLLNLNQQFGIDTSRAADISERSITNRKFQLRRNIMFAVIRHYHFNPKDSAEIDRRVREEFVPIVKKAKGFVRYYWLDTGKGEGASVSVFKDKAGADESVHLAADYVREHLSKFITQRPEIIEGPIKAHD
jgi:quinol monooxygenase YgiN